MRTKRGWLAALACVCLSLAISSQAAFINVTSPNDSGPDSLRAAVAAAAAGDMIMITSSNVFLTNEIVIDKDLRIIGSDTTITGNFLNRGFRIAAGNVGLLGLKLQNFSASSLNPPNGGAIYNSGTLLLQFCDLYANRAQVGGAIYNAGILTIQNTRVGIAGTGNHAGRGGGLANAGTAVIELDSEFLENDALSGGGGAVANEVSGFLAITNTMVRLNQARYFGGGGIINFGALVLDTTSFAGNVCNRDSDEVVGGGGAIYNSGGSVLINNCIIGGNTEVLNPNAARRGGGILNISVATNAPALLNISRSLFRLNQAEDFGGAIMNLANGGPAMVNLTNCVLDQNFVGEGFVGGSIQIIGNPDRTAAAIDNSSYLGDAIVTIVNCTILRNQYSTELPFELLAGGLYSGSFSSNVARIQIANTILADNTAPQAVQDGGLIVSLGHNLIADTSIAAAAGDLPGTAPAFSLTGAPALDLNSPAVDAGNASFCTGIDFRGIARPQGASCDIGAYEFVFPVAAPLAIAQVYNKGNDLWVRFVSQTGRSYSLEHNAGCGISGWSSIEPVLAGNGGLVTVTNPLPAIASGSGFFRVRQLSP